MEGKTNVLVGVRGQIDFVKVAWVGLLCHGEVSVSKERLREKKRLTCERKKKWVKTLSRPGK